MTIQQKVNYLSKVWLNIFNPTHPWWVIILASFSAISISLWVFFFYLFLLRVALKAIIN